MKSILIVVLILLINPVITYGQEPSAQPFLPDVISQFPNVRDLTMSTDGNEIYFTVQSPLGELSAIVYCNKVNDEWTKPEVASFSGRFHDLEPFLAPGGMKLYFASNRPVSNDSTATKDYDIWYVERKDQGGKWSAPVNLGSPVNTKSDEFYPSVSMSNNLYFTSDGNNSKGKDDIFFSKWQNGKYDAPVSLSDSVNSPGYEFNAFIAPDESYLLYTCYNREGGSGSGDLYVSFHKGDGQWTTAANLGKEVNSPQMDYCPFYDVGSGLLYFTSKRSSIHTRFSQNQTMAGIMKELTRYENGMSRLYSIKIRSLFDRLR